MSLFAYYREIGFWQAMDEIRRLLLCRLIGHKWQHVQDWHCWDEGACAMIDEWWECPSCESFRWEKP